MRLLLLLLAVPLVACAAGQPASTCSSDPGAAARASVWQDPVEVLDRYDGPSFSELMDVEVDGDLVWFCTGVIGLNVYDAADPSDLAFLDRAAPSAGNQTYPRCQHLAVAPDRRVYVANRGDAISTASFVAVFDGSDPSALTEIGSRPVDDVEGITVAGDLLLAAAHADGLLLFDRGDGGQLDPIATFGELVNAWNVRARDGLAFVADGTGGLAVVDLAEPAAPTLVHRLELPGVARDLELDGDRAWVALGGGGLAAVSLADPRAPALLEVEQTPGSALGVAAGGGGVYVADWNDIRVFDARDRDDLVPVGREPVQVAQGGDSRILGIAARDDVLFAGNWTELVSHRWHPDRTAPDLVATPRLLNLPATAGGDTGVAEVTLHNVGTEPLDLDGVDASAATLSVDPAPTGPLAPGGQLDLEVRWSPAGGGTLDGWLAFRSDDPDQPRLCLPTRGGGAGAGVGEPAPDLDWVDLDGDVHRLSALDGEAVLLAYFATW